MLIERRACIHELEARIWEALQSPPDEHSLGQHCQLAMYFSLLGHERFTQWLFELVSGKPISGDLSLGEEELLVAAGAEGFIAAARKRGERLQNTQWDWDDDRFLENSASVLTQSIVLEILHSHRDVAIRRFYAEHSRQTSMENVPIHQPSYRDRMSSISVDDLFEASRSSDRCGWFRSWGIQARQRDIELVLEHIVASKVAEVRSKLLKVFWKRELPRVDAALIEFCQSTNRDLAFAAFRALEGNSHPLIREFGIQTLAAGDSCRAIELLTRNYRAHDENMIFDAMQDPSNDPDELHSLIMACNGYLEQNPSADAEQLGLLSYEQTPCSLCRTQAVKRLKEQHLLPMWMIEEVRYDCDVSTRGLLYPQTGPSPTCYEFRRSQLRGVYR